MRKKREKNDKIIDMSINDAYKIGTNISLKMAFIISFIILLMINDVSVGISLNMFLFVYLLTFVIITLILYGLVQLFIPFSKKTRKKFMLFIEEKKACSIGFIVSVVISVIAILMLTDLCRVISNFNGDMDVVAVDIVFLFIIFVMLTSTVLGFVFKLSIESDKELLKDKIKSSKKYLIATSITKSFGFGIIISVICSFIYSVGVIEITSLICDINSSSCLYFLFLIIFVMVLIPQLLLIIVQSRISDKND